MGTDIWAVGTLCESQFLRTDSLPWHTNLNIRSQFLRRLEDTEVINFSREEDSAAFYRHFNMRYGKEGVTWFNPVLRGDFPDTYSYIVLTDVIYH